jgi:EpsI family protein
MITRRLVAVQVVLLVAFVGIFLLPKQTKSSPAGIAMTLPNFVDGWIADDAEVTAREREVLAKDTEFARKIYTSPAGDQIYVSIVMSGDDMTNSIHRPERCLPAQGWSLQGTEKRTIPVSGGAQLQLTRLRNVRAIEQPDGSRPLLHNLNYYWFIGYKDMTASHLERTGLDLRDRILHGYSQRWAYVTVAANITKGWVRPERNEEQATAIVEKFIAELAPKLQRPDGQQLLVAQR